MTQNIRNKLFQVLASQKAFYDCGYSIKYLAEQTTYNTCGLETCSDVYIQNELHSSMTILTNNSRSSAINAGKYTKAKRDEYLSVVPINVNGIKSKLKAPDF